MAGLWIVWLWSAGGLAAGHNSPALVRFEFTQVEMAVPFKLVLYAPDAAAATSAARAAFARVHALNAIMSDYDPESELNRLCRTSGEGKAVPVSDDLWKVLAHAEALSARCEGAFDVTVGPVVRLWRRARRRGELPPPEDLNAARALVGYRLVRLDPQRHAVELLKPGMRLDLGGIAKGYATEEALRALNKAGISRALVDAGGDLRLGDPPPDAAGWKVGLTPLDNIRRPTSYLVLANVAVSTSGDAIQFVEIGGRWYSHIVDPRTGMGLTDRSRVTVVAPDGMVADGLTKAVVVLGPEKGLKLIDETPYAAAFLTRVPEGKIQSYPSKRWKSLAEERVTGE
ncbi:MAG: FAD:protein FMN transferase [Thermoguttaceae bacterium]|jgi:thiamine biosynthesis lipoprotein